MHIIIYTHGLSSNKSSGAIKFPISLYLFILKSFGSCMCLCHVSAYNFPPFRHGSFGRHGGFGRGSDTCDSCNRRHRRHVSTCHPKQARFTCGDSICGKKNIDNFLQNLQVAMRRNKIPWDEPSLLLFLLRLGCSAAAQSNQSFNGRWNYGANLREHVVWERPHLLSVTVKNSWDSNCYILLLYYYHLKMGKKRVACWKIK